jgi:Flp pilus assembly protein TadD
MNQPLSSDLLIAEAQIEMGNADAGLRQINPYIAQAKRDPQKYAPVVLTYLRGLMRSGDAETARQTLVPLLPQNTTWRQAWIRMAVRFLRQADEIQSWLVQVSEHIAPDAIDERVMLAQGWYSLWLATQNTGYFDRAHAILRDVAQREDASAEAVLALAMLLDGDGRRAQAQQHYRRALELDASLPAAQNNLAVILLEAEESPQQAAELARQAVTQQPYNPDFLDTLALAESQVGNVDVALTHIRKAVELEPNNLAWRLSHAEILAAAGQADDAQQVIRQINSRWPQDDLPAGLADRYNRLQNRMVQN